MFVRKKEAGSGSAAAVSAVEDLEAKMRETEKKKAARTKELDKEIADNMEKARACAQRAKEGDKNATETAKRHLLFVKKAEQEKARIEDTMMSLKAMHLSAKTTEFSIETTSVMQAAARVQMEQTQRVDPTKMEALSAMMEKNYHQLKTTENVIKAASGSFLERAIDDLVEGDPVMQNDAISDVDLLRLLEAPVATKLKSAATTEPAVEDEREEWQKILYSN